MKHYILNAFLETPWAILPHKLAALDAIVTRHVAGEKLSGDDVQAAISGTPRPAERTINRVAVLPLFGAIIPRAELLSEVSGATSAEAFGAKFDGLVNDTNVSAIVLDVNSPGGQVGGVQELADKIFAARGTKPIVAVANHLAASAAYWIATAADELVVTPSSEVGSVGVYAAHEDVSKALDQEGVKVSLISAGKHKVEGNPYEPLSDDARAAIQQKVSAAYEDFIASVARNRGANLDQVRNGFGEGRTVRAKQAVEYGMADRIATLEEVIHQLSAGSGQAPAPQAVSTNVQDISAMLAQVREDKQNLNARLFSQLHVGGESMNVREIKQARADLLKRASDITELADVENRTLSAEERAEFEKCLADADGMLAEINQFNSERERLRAALEASVTIPATEKAEKPDAAVNPKVKTLAEFNQLTPAERMAYIKGGGKIE